MLHSVSQDKMIFIIQYQFIIADMSNLFPAWALLLTSSALREAIYELLVEKFRNMRPRATERVSVTENHL